MEVSATCIIIPEAGFAVVERRCLAIAVALGAILSIAHAIRKLRHGESPDFGAIIEILFASIGFGVALKIGWLAWKVEFAAPVTLTDEDRYYFAAGAFTLGWVSAASIIRRFEFERPNVPRKGRIKRKATKPPKSPTGTAASNLPPN